MSESIMTLKSLQKMLRSIYDEHDREFFSDTDLLLRVNEEVSKIDELVRKEDIEEIARNLPRLFVWLMAFIDRVGIDISDALWEKYPGVCPYCLKEQNCMCITQETKYDSCQLRLKEIREKKENIPKSLTGWQQSLAAIYGNVNRLQMLIQIWLHVCEEIGEISGAFRKKWGDNLREEVADAMAWLLSVSTKLRTDLQEAVLKQYPGRCDVCGKEKCECGPC